MCVYELRKPDIPPCSFSDDVSNSVAGPVVATGPANHRAGVLAAVGTPADAGDVYVQVVAGTVHGALTPHGGLAASPAGPAVRNRQLRRPTGRVVERCRRSPAGSPSTRSPAREPEHHHVRRKPNSVPGGAVDRSGGPRESEAGTHLGAARVPDRGVVHHAVAVPVCIRSVHGRHGVVG